MRDAIRFTICDELAGPVTVGVHGLPAPEVLAYNYVLLLLIKVWLQKYTYTFDQGCILPSSRVPSLPARISRK